MKNRLFVLINIMVWLHSCHLKEPTNPTFEFITTKPGYFCQLEAVTLVGDTIVIAGSYIAKEDPNLTVQPVYSYLAAFSFSGKMIWEQTPEAADYVRWKFLLPLPTGGLNVIGIEESPTEGNFITIHPIDLKTGKSPTLHHLWEEGLPLIKDAQFNAREIVLLRAIPNDTLQCTTLQHINLEGGRYLLPDCHGGQVQETAFLNPYPDYLATFGDGFSTQNMYIYTSADVPRNIPLPVGFTGHLVNNIGQLGSEHALLATTIKNTQGPCLWKSSGMDTTWQHTCLYYWPFHGTALLRQMGHCTVMAFNAADTAKASSAYLVAFDEGLNVLWQQKIDSTEVFVIKDWVIENDKVIVAGTIQTAGQGSEMAVKIIPLPPLACQGAIQ
ncbi:hypothetical protein BH09BAC1_BH09BAC1_08100 [soil metagenome]